MASSSTVPPPPSSGGARYAIAGVALAALAGLGWCLTRPPEPVDTGPAPVAIDAGQRSTALVEDDFVIPDLEPDAGPIDGGQPEEVVRRPTHPRPTGSWDECSGEIQTAQARTVVGEYNAQIRSCYERRLKANPLLQGTMMLAVRVASDGHVEGVQVTGTLHDRDVFSCVRGIANRMRFPPPGGRDCAVVQVPYTFTPRQ